MGELSVMGKPGDTKVEWSRDNPDEVAAARATFTSLRGRNYLAFRLDREGHKGEQITEFDPRAERILLVPPMRGGVDA